jgi:hypothetical protein
MRRGSKKTIRAGFTVTVAAIAATCGVAQAQNSPVTASLTFSTRVDANSNRALAAVSPGATFGISENLSFSVRTETRSQLLELFGGASVSLNTAPGGGTTTSANNPKLTLRYTRDAANANLMATADYWSGDVISTFDADPTAAVNLVVDTGTLVRSSATFVGNIGVNAPLGLTVNASVNWRNYSGTTDPSLFDETTTNLGATANLRISPTTQGSLTVNQTNYVSTDPFSTTYQAMNYSARASHNLANGVTLNANIGYQDKRTTVSNVTTFALGLNGGVGINKALPNGSIFGDVQVDLSSGSPQTALTFGRVLDMPSGTLRASLTADMSAANGVRWSGSAAYTQQLSDGSLSVKFNQSLSTNYLSQDILNSNLTLGYQKALNSVAGLNMSLKVSRSEDGGAGAAPTLGRATLSASYSRSLTPDWDISVGYSHQQSTSSVAATANSDSLFLTLTRDLQFSF